MKKNKYIELLLKESIKEEEVETKKSTIGNKLFKKILLRIVSYITLKIAIITLLFIIIFLPVILIIAMFLSLSSGGITSDNNSEYSISGDTFIGNFSEDNLDIPLGIPVERGLITYGYDYKKYASNIINSFIRIAYSNAREYYVGHSGIDFGLTYQDKQDSYLPYVLSTSRGVIKRIETREEDGNKLLYKRKEYNGANFVTSNSNSTKSKEADVKPYGNHVIVSTMDGKFYIVYAHLSQLNNQFLEETNIGRGNIIGRIGTTGNSTGLHLHYEIRYCGENNGNIGKLWTSCTPVNPLGTIIGSENTFLGFSTLPSINKFVAGNIENIKENYEKEDDIYEKINEEYKTFCNNSGILLNGSNVKCKEIFPIIYSSKNNELLPKIYDKGTAEEIGRKYIKSEYNIEGVLDINKINEIKKIEGINRSIYTEKELYISIGESFSNGRYINRFNYYKSLNKDSEDLMLQDLIKALEKIKRKNNNIQDIYKEYYLNNAYKDGFNPYIYNMISSNKIFLDILDNEGNFISKYNKFGAYTIYKNLK